MSCSKTIDFSRYRVAEAIASFYATGDPAEALADEYFDYLTLDQGTYMVELIVAAHDRKDKYAPKGAAS